MGEKFDFYVYYASEVWHYDSTDVSFSAVSWMETPAVKVVFWLKLF